MTRFQFSIDDLVVAYRKAKADMFFERDHIGALAFTKYEEHLFDNLEKLRSRINPTKPDWMSDPDIIGTYSYIPKKLEPPVNKSGLATIVSNRDEAWEECIRVGGKVEVQFRVVGIHSVDFHVISALWIQKVGHLFDSALDSSAHGHRLRRLPGDKSEYSRAPNEIAIGSFQPYVDGFRKWRDGGMSSAKKEIEAGERVAAITADLRAFYHRVRPDYLLNKDFLDRTGIQLSRAEERFTSQLISAIRYWASQTNEHKLNPNIGLPVGLSASRLIANCSLIEFDRLINRDIIPIYYGRYVDDIFLVLRNPGHWRTASDVWKHIIDRSNGTLQFKKEDEDDLLVLNLSYQEEDMLQFSGKKQKVFLLEGLTGKTLLENIDYQITRRSSEWRLLPDLPEDTDDLIHDFVGSGGNGTEDVDNLRKSDGLSVRRLSFAIRLRNLEAVERDLPPPQWEEHRRRFLEIARKQVLSPLHFFDFSPYLSRLIGLAVSSQDWREALQLVERMQEIFKHLDVLFDRQEREGEVNSSRKLREQRDRCVDYLMLRVLEASLKAMPMSSSKIRDKAGCKSYLECLNKTFQQAPSESRESNVRSKSLSIEVATRYSQRLFISDLGRVPFRECILGMDKHSRGVALHSSRIEAEPSATWLARLHSNEAVAFFDRALPELNSHGPLRAATFPTRPLTLAEVTYLDQGLLRDPEKLSKLMWSLRGGRYRNGVMTPPFSPFSIGNDDDGQNDPPTKCEFLHFNAPQSEGQIAVAVPSIETLDASWKASVTCTSDPDGFNRFVRINRLVNAALKAPTKPRYIVFPELSLPRRFFQRIAHKLLQNKISLIAGVEYEHRGAPTGCMPPAKGWVSNQICASLVVNFDGYVGACVLVQEKVRPSQREGQDLWNLAGRVLVPNSPSPDKHIVLHGDFSFGMLICSELTNIDFRAGFRGRVDALFVPEWNRDIDTFSSIVESSAFDIHCFIVQVNNRPFGDSRIRGPLKEGYERDVVRIKGGADDYLVIGKIAHAALREFQSNYQSPNGPFKPVPDGFQIHIHRRSPKE